MTDEERAVMLARYASHRAAIEGLADELGVPVHQIIAWAVHLGLRDTRPIRRGAAGCRHWGSITSRPKHDDGRQQRQQRGAR